MKLPKPGPLRHEHRVVLMASAAGLPALVVALVLLWTGDFTPKVQWTLTSLVALFWLAFLLAAHGAIVRPLQTLSNLLHALREGDYSIRARGARIDDALGEVIVEVNALGETLRTQRLGAVEATLLLRRVMTEIEVAIFTFDVEQRLRLVNRAGERLLAQPAERLLGRRASELGLAECLDGDVPRTAQLVFPGGIGRWGVSRSRFREGGRPHQLLVLTDLSRALREEERQAWQRLLRVLGHELNNSLAPIRSIAGSLETLVVREPLPEDWREDVQGGLAVINSRAEALTRFMQAYSRLARLPQPKMQPLELSACIHRVLSLEMRIAVEAVPGPHITIQADSDQIEQLLINLLRNAVDAALETGGGVSVRWMRDGAFVDVLVEDEGPGLSSTANLFVPFFTTKPGGSGIGLVLSRQIAEAHGGSLSLQNRTDRQGCEARLRLPL
jgi:two-component system, NtrC family, nitrogen regulation sensor histidine kinase NtrY